ncbi:MAG: helix-turn-helix domain-containing protein, partial [Halobacteria archaeon]|nr:helix-turn-helix domain-containing protein [Halobacteria archaeon]
MADLTDLGLSEYEARVYRSLLDSGSATAKNLSQTSDVPMGRVYDVLASLEKHSLVRSQTASRPKKYVAVEPETALDRLIDDKKRELEEEMERYKNIADSLTDELESSEPVDERFWTAAVGPDESIDLLLERLDAANESITTVAGEVSPQFDPEELGETALDHLVGLVESDVEVRLLITPKMVEQFGADVQERYVETLSGNPKFEVRTLENLRGNFNLIDGNEVCVEVTNPVAPDQVFAMIDLKDPEFASRVEEEVSS